MPAIARFVFATLLAGTLDAAPGALESIKWNELSSVILNRAVLVDMKDGSAVKAVVQSVEPTALIASVSPNASSKYTKGEVTIKRDQIVRLRILKMRKRGRILCTTTGAVLGLLVGSMVGVAGSGGAAAGVMVSAPVAGYFIGRSLDRQETVINILPD